VKHELFSLTQHAFHRGDLFNHLIYLIRVLLYPLKPATRLLKLTLNLQRVLGRIEDGKLRLCRGWRKNRAKQNAEQYPLDYFRPCYE
jgi:hypothetical protein